MIQDIILGIQTSAISKRLRKKQKFNHCENFQIYGICYSKFLKYMIIIHISMPEQFMLLFEWSKLLL